MKAGLLQLHLCLSRNQGSTKLNAESGRVRHLNLKRKNSQLTLKKLFQLHSHCMGIASRVKLVKSALAVIVE